MIKGEKFSVKSFYSTLELEGELSFPLKLVWDFGLFDPSAFFFFFVFFVLFCSFGSGKQLEEGFLPWTSLKREDGL